MLKINIQLFAHKKGMGSTKNGRDQRDLAQSVPTVSLFLQVTSFTSSAEHTSIRATTLARVLTILFSLSSTVLLSTSVGARIARRSAYIPLSSNLY